MASSSWRPNATSMSFNKNYKPFPSSTNYSQFSTNRGSINNLRNSRQFPNSPTNSNNTSSRSHKLISWFIDWLIGYPIWIQSIITAIIGFIAYFLYDYASNIQSFSYYLLYKTTSIILFLILVAFLNMNKSKANLNNINLNISPNTSNPYSMSSSQSFTKSNPTPSNPISTQKNKLHTDIPILNAMTYIIPNKPCLIASLPLY